MFVVSVNACVAPAACDSRGAIDVLDASTVARPGPGQVGPRFTVSGRLDSISKRSFARIQCS